MTGVARRLARGIDRVALAWRRRASPLPAPLCRSDAATLDDVRYCFRLLLGRDPHAKEWPHHRSRLGSPVASVVRAFLASPEFRRRRLLDHPVPDLREAVCEGFRLYVDPKDLDVGHEVLHGSYEPHVARVFRDVLSPGAVAIDVGANIGYFSMLAASRVGPGGRVIALEPNPRNVRLLLASARRNAFGNVEVVQAAAAEEFGVARLFSEFSNGQIALDAADLEEAGAETVGCVPLASIAARLGRCDLVKLDIEGAELLALRGLFPPAQALRPVLVIEFCPDKLRNVSRCDPEALFELLVPLGYRIHAIGRDGRPSPAGSAHELVARLAASGLEHLDLLALPGA